MFRIGRIQLTNVGSWRPDLAGQVRVSGKITGLDPDVATHWALQLLELLDTGRRGSLILPVTWDDNQAVNGYYAVTGGSVTPIDDSVLLGWEYELDLQKLPGGHALPRIESILQGGYRPNAHIANTARVSGAFTAGVDPVAEWHVPAGAIEIAMPSATMGSPDFTATVYDTIRVMGFPSGQTTIVGRYAVAPVNYYQGGCLIETQVGSTWLPVVGTQLVVTDPTKLRISNGYMGAMFGTASDFGVTFFGFGRTAGVLNWTQKGNFNRISGNGSTIQPIGVQAITVLRNDPEEIRLRVSWTAGVIWSSGAIDISLRRGGDNITIGGNPGVWINAPTGVACTSTTGGIFQTTAVSGVQPWVLSAPAFAGNSTPASGKLFVDNNTYVGIGVGPVWDPYVADVFPGGTAVRWFAPLSERQRIVGR